MGEDDRGALPKLKSGREGDAHEASHPGSGKFMVRFAEILLTLLGLTAVLSLPVIWMAWSKTMFYGILIVAFGSIAAIMLINRYLRWRGH